MLLSYNDWAEAIPSCFKNTCMIKKVKVSVNCGSFVVYIDDNGKKKVGRIVAMVENELELNLFDESHNHSDFPIPSSLIPSIVKELHQTKMYEIIESDALEDIAFVFNEKKMLDGTADVTYMSNGYVCRYRAVDEKSSTRFVDVDIEPFSYLMLGYCAHNSGSCDPHRIWYTNRSVRKALVESMSFKTNPRHTRTIIISNVDPMYWNYVKIRCEQVSTHETVSGKHCKSYNLTHALQLMLVFSESPVEIMRINSQDSLSILRSVIGSACVGFGSCSNRPTKSNRVKTCSRGQEINIVNVSTNIKCKDNAPNKKMKLIGCPEERIDLMCNQDNCELHVSCKCSSLQLKPDQLAAKNVDELIVLEMGLELEQKPLEVHPLHVVIKVGSIFYCNSQKLKVVSVRMDSVVCAPYRRGQPSDEELVVDDLVAVKNAIMARLCDT